MTSTIKKYIGIARPDHWIKNIFVLPGFIAAVFMQHAETMHFIGRLFLCGASVCLISSANYAINEWLDARFDRFHPSKKNRPAARGALRAPVVYCEYGILGLAGLGAALFISTAYFITSLGLLVMGVIYNAKPLRTKEVAYLDVLSESINNPLRFLLGWFVVTAGAFPPSSLLLGYWMGGAFLMAMKRLAELRTIGDPVKAALYRHSFKFYREETLIVSAFSYALCAAFFLGVLMIKYRIELLLSFPLLSVFFGWYMLIAFKPDSAAQHPEKLYREKLFMGYSALLAALLILLLTIDVPGLHWLLTKWH